MALIYKDCFESEGELSWDSPGLSMGAGYLSSGRFEDFSLMLSNPWRIGKVA